MKSLTVAVTLALIFIVGTFFLFWRPAHAPTDSQAPAQTSMKLTSSAFAHNQAIPPVYTCDGSDVNPPLAIAGVPPAAQSLALIADDPDAPKQGGFVHWTLWNIPPLTDEIGENSVPSGAAQGVTDFGKPGYGGPCPPSGTHRYFFKLYALDTMLELPPATTRDELLAALEGHVLASAEIIGTYQRP